MAKLAPTVEQLREMCDRFYPALQTEATSREVFDLVADWAVEAVALELTRIGGDPTGGVVAAVRAMKP